MEGVSELRVYTEINKDLKAFTLARQVTLFAKMIGWTGIDTSVSNTG